ncbi:MULTISPECIES: hypothetical protein [unclassified Rickettsia]
MLWKLLFSRLPHSLQSLAMTILVAMQQGLQRLAMTIYVFAY